MANDRKNISQDNGNPTRKPLTDAELDQLAKTEAERLSNKFGKKVTEYIEKEKKKK